MLLLIQRFADAVLRRRLRRLQTVNHALRSQLAACRVERDVLEKVVARNHRRVLSEIEAWPLAENRNAV